MPEPQNNNRPEAPLSVKLINGYIEQVDRFGPALVKSFQDYRDACVSGMGLTKKTVLDLVGRSGRKPPFINTAADAFSGVVSALLNFQCTSVDALIKAHRNAVVSVRDAMTGKAPG